MSSLIVSLIIGGLAGWLAGIIRKGSGFGLLTNIGVGILGGFLGNILFGFLGIQGDGFIASLIISTLGAVVLLAILSFFQKN